MKKNFDFIIKTLLQWFISGHRSIISFHFWWCYTTLSHINAAVSFKLVVEEVSGSTCSSCRLMVASWLHKAIKRNWNLPFISPVERYLFEVAVHEPSIHMIPARLNQGKMMVNFWFSNNRTFWTPDFEKTGNFTYTYIWSLVS